MPKVSVIIPVYNGIEHLRVLFSTLCTNTVNVDCRFLVVDDASPDPEVECFLAAQAKNDPRVEVFRNEHNMGFVKSVNRALRVSRGAHCVLLNSDTSVPFDWLSRLIRPILDDSSVATVTPFSNGALIYSIPVVGSDNRDFIKRFSVDEIDRKVQACHLPNECREAPYGHGFCMAMNAVAIEKIGILDEEAFGKGYGEELDWCLRATAAGFHHRVACVFVSHYHCGSFPTEEKRRLIAEHGKIILERYPWYDEINGRHKTGNGVQWKSLVSDVVVDALATDWNGAGRPAKRVLLVSHELSLTGAPKSLLRQARYLRDAGCIVEVASIAGGPMRAEFVREGFDVLSVKGGVEGARAACDVLGRRRFDLIICNTIATFRFVQELGCGRPVVWFLREIAAVERAIGKNSILPTLVASYPYVYTVSEYAARSLARYNANIKYINNSVEDAFTGFAPRTEKIRFGFIGSINPNKNISGLIDAYLALRKKTDRVSLDICGHENAEGQPLTTKLQALLQGVPDVRWRGQVSGAEKQDFYDSIDVLCVPSYSEASCLSLLEGAMHGKALISTDGVGANYVLKEGGGIVVHAGSVEELLSAMTEMTENPEVVTTMQRKAREGYLSHATVDKERSAVVELLEEIPTAMRSHVPVVSVVVPIFNQEPYLRKCLDSILRQTFVDFEVICVDDGSTDGSALIVEEYARRDSRITLVRQENAGGGAARNTGIEHAQGEYLYFCDPDDYIHPELLSRLVSACAENNAEMAVCRYTRFDGVTGKAQASFQFAGGLSKRIGEGARFVTPAEMSESLFIMAGYGPVNKIYLRRWINEKGIRFQNLRRTNDMFFVVTALANATRIGIVNKSLYNYRVGINSTTHKDELAASFCEALKAVKKRLVEDGKYELLKPCFLPMAVTSLINNVTTCYDSDVLRRLYSTMRSTVLSLVGGDGVGKGRLATNFIRKAYEVVSSYPDPLPLLMLILQETRSNMAAKTAKLQQVEAELKSSRKELADKDCELRDALAKSKALLRERNKLHQRPNSIKTALIFIIRQLMRRCGRR